jgi:hypothetical protein
MGVFQIAVGVTATDMSLRTALLLGFLIAPLVGAALFFFVLWSGRGILENRHDSNTASTKAPSAVVENEIFVAALAAASSAR